MPMHITIELPLSSHDAAVLTKLVEQSQSTGPKPIAKETTTGVAKKVAPKAAEPEPEEPTPADEPSPRDLAIALATKMVGSGQTAKVKAALADIAVAKVSQVTDEDAEAFLSALQS